MAIMHVSRGIKTYQLFVNISLPKLMCLLVPMFWISVISLFYVVVCCFSCVIVGTIFFSTNIYPSAGISMTMEQWEAFCNAAPAIEDAIKKLEDSD
jgi:hypothetical protein